MERFENLLDFINELNENSRIQYEDYSRLFDLASELYGLEEAVDAAKTDIAALLWLNGNCEYCEHGEEENFCGASRWHCKLGSKFDCKPKWRGATMPSQATQKTAPTSGRAKPMTRAERMFGPKETWARPDSEAEDVLEAKEKLYKGFLLIRCGKCGQMHGFCAKTPIAQYRCRDCDGITPLCDLTSLQIRCKCGQRFKYQTNLQEDTFTYNCLTCGAPVDVAYNKKAHTYQTVL